VNVPDSSLEGAFAGVRRWAKSAAETSAGELAAANTRTEVANTRAEVANTRKRRLEGDPEALQGCSLEELRQVGLCRFYPG
jgi:hypothetical protein